MDSILLTGVAGFIGYKTAELLLERGFFVTGIDNMNDYYDVRLKEYRLNRLLEYKGFRFYRIDIEDLGVLEKLFKDNRFFIVINLAAMVGVRYSIIEPFSYTRTNIVGTTNLLELCKDHNVYKFILASTSSLYAGQKMPFKEDLPVNEPLSVYAATKKAAEVISYTYHHLYDIRVIVLRFFTVYGPAGRPDMSIFRFIRWIDEDRPIELFGDGTQRRDFTYIDDIAEGIVSALTIDMGYGIINLGNSRPNELNTAIGFIERYLGKRAKRKMMPFHKADLKATWADITKAQNLLGWRPTVFLEEGIERTVKWYLDNKEWVKELRP